MISENKLLQGIDTIIVRVRDFEKSRNWYTEVLGFSIEFNEPTMKLAVFNTFGPTSLTIWETQAEVRSHKDTASYPIFKTPDAGALREELLRRGVRAEELTTDDYVTYFIFYDPDGNVLEACQVHE